MEHYLRNVFFSYGSGSYKDLKSIKQLENNITRSFIYTLNNIELKYQQYFLEKILGVRNIKNKINYDLQNFDDKDELRKLQNSNNTKKYLLTIAREKYDKNKEYFKFDKSIINFIQDLDKMEGEKKNIATLISDSYKELKKNDVFKNISLKINGHSYDITEDNYYSIYETCIQKSIPDAWIYNDEFIILIETKVGTNKIFPPQLFRHLKDDNGLLININDILLGESCEHYSLINLSWDDIFKSLEDLYKLIKSSNTNNISNYLINNFMEYLIMNGEVLSLSFITEENIGYNTNDAKKMFPLFTRKLNEEVKKIDGLNINFRLAERNLTNHVWDYFGIYAEVKNKNKDKGKDTHQWLKTITLDPHYSIYFDNEGLAIALTIKNNWNRDLILKFLSNPKLIDFFKNINPQTKENLARYSLNLMDYNAVDGNQNTQRFTTFSFYTNFFKLYKKGYLQRNTEKRSKFIENFIGSYISVIEFAEKQIELKYNFQYPDEAQRRLKNRNNYENMEDKFNLMKENTEYFRNHNEIIKKFVEFIKGTYNIFNDIDDFRMEDNNDRIRRLK